MDPSVPVGPIGVPSNVMAMQGMQGQPFASGLLVQHAHPQLQARMPTNPNNPNPFGPNIGMANMNPGSMQIPPGATQAATHQRMPSGNVVGMPSGSPNAPGRPPVVGGGGVLSASFTTPAQLQALHHDIGFAHRSPSQVQDQHMGQQRPPSRPSSSATTGFAPPQARTPVQSHGTPVQMQSSPQRHGPSPLYHPMQGASQPKPPTPQQSMAPPSNQGPHPMSGMNPGPPMHVRPPSQPVIPMPIGGNLASAIGQQLPPQPNAAHRVPIGQSQGPMQQHSLHPTGPTHPQLPVRKAAPAGPMQQAPSPGQRQNVPQTPQSAHPPPSTPAPAQVGLGLGVPLTSTGAIQQQSPSHQIQANAEQKMTNNVPHGHRDSPVPKTEPINLTVPPVQGPPAVVKEEERVGQLNANVPISMDHPPAAPTAVHYPGSM